MDQPARVLRCRWPLLIALACLPWSEASAAKIVGATLARDAKPVRHVKIGLAPALPNNDPRASHRTAESDEQGRFEFSEVPPGPYVLRATKPGWIDVEEQVYVKDAATDEVIEVRLAMELTPLRKWMAQVQLGLLIYVVLFGLLVLVVNYWVMPAPSREIGTFGWGAMAISVVIALIKTLWVEAALLAAVGAAGGGLITRFGRRVVQRRLAAAEEESRREEARHNEERHKLLALVGRSGTTLSDLRACGTAEVSGEVFEVRAFEGYIPQGAKVVVRSVEGRTLIVQRPAETTAPSGAPPETAQPEV